jgi:L-alanine-DL-glutamate epimerase-like enolase superfamily enzyme
MGRKFEQYNIYWLEEPVPADDFAGYQRIAAALDMRVVAARRISRATTCGRSSSIRACRSCSPTRCAVA